MNSDDRQKAAERLRELVSEHGAVQCDAVSHVLGLEYEVHGCIAAFNREDVTALADLIDPTCEVKNDNRYTSDFDYVCRACGEHFSTCDRPNYCPECGKRVVSNDDQ